MFGGDMKRSLHPRGPLSLAHFSNRCIDLNLRGLAMFKLQRKAQRLNLSLYAIDL
jgi:hypothetical protein